VQGNSKMNNILNTATLLAICLTARVINTIQKQTQRQAHTYQQQRKIIKKQTAEKNKPVIRDKITTSDATQPVPSELPLSDQPTAADRLASLKQNLLHKEAGLLKLEQDLKKITNPKEPIKTDRPAPIKQNPVQEPQVNDTIKVAPIQTTQSTSCGQTKPAQKVQEHRRICPTCGELSTICSVDQERLSNGKILPCACKECFNKNYGDEYFNPYV